MDISRCLIVVAIFGLLACGGQKEQTNIVIPVAGPLDISEFPESGPLIKSPQQEPSYHSNVPAYNVDKGETENLVPLSNRYGDGPPMMLDPGSGVLVPQGDGKYYRNSNGDLIRIR